MRLFILSKTINAEITRQSECNYEIDEYKVSGNYSAIHILTEGRGDKRGPRHAEQSRLF